MRKLTGHTWKPTVLLAIVAVLMGGCDRNNSGFSTGDAHLPIPTGSISIYQLAGRLNMTVADSTPIVATLRDPANVVLIYSDPGGQAFVNGRPVGPIGGIKPGGGILFVPGNLAETIRPMLRSKPPQSIVVLKPAVPPPPPRNIATVVLDAGHGGHKTGTVSVRGYPEKHVTLKVTLAIAQRLEAEGVKVILTRSTDKHVGLNERAEIANRNRADLFISIHADWSDRSQANGFAVFVRQNRPLPASRALANAIERRMAATGTHSRGVKNAYDDWRVLKLTRAPAVLIELGFLSNYHDSRQLARPAYRRKLAEAISRGVVDHIRSR